MSDGIRVAIVDDHAIVRQGLRTLLLGVSMDVVGEASCGDQAVQLAQEKQPDVMLLDIRMKPCDGLTALPRILSASPQTKVIILTTYSNPTYLTEAIKGGACGYLLKDSEPNDIVRTIQAAASQSYLFDPALLNQTMQMQHAAPNEKPPAAQEPPPEALEAIEPVSERELDVLRLMAKGMSNAAIADALQLSVTTVKTHITHIFRKLNVNDRTQAVLTAMRHGLVN